MPSGVGKDQLAEAIRELTNVINSQSKMIREQGIKLEELEAKLLQKTRLNEVEKGTIETKLAAVAGLVQETQVKLSTLFQQAILGQPGELSSGQWPSLPPARRPGHLSYLANSTTPLNRTVRPAQNNSETNDRTITLDISRLRVEKRSAGQIKDMMTNIMQAQAETKECKSQQARILPEGKIELSMESNSQYENAQKHPRWLELAMTGARIKREKWFPVKCDNVTMCQNPK